MEEKEQQEKKFEPITITITIESEEELCDLFHRLNVSVKTMQKQYLNDHDILKHGVNLDGVKLFDKISHFVKLMDLYKH